MKTIATPDRSTTKRTDAQRTPATPESCSGQEWTLRRVEQTDVRAVKAMFQRLHTFNAALDPRFALSTQWEAHFDAAMHEALGGIDSIGFIARETKTGRPCGFALTGVHRDSDMWRYREWVEVEALYVEAAWRGRGLAEVLLACCCEWAESVGQPVVQLYVTASNERAIRFYQHSGFCQTQAIMRREQS